MTDVPRRHVVPIPVRYRDLDTFAHVNNAVFLTYMEIARVAFWRDVLGIPSVDDVDFLVARIEIDYRRPVRIEDPLTAAVWIEKIGRTSFTAGYEFRVGAVAVAEGRSVQVFIDRGSQSPKPVPDEFRTKVAPYVHGA